MSSSVCIAFGSSDDCVVSVGGLFKGDEGFRSRCRVHSAVVNVLLHQYGFHFKLRVRNMCIVQDNSF